MANQLVPSLSAPSSSQQITTLYRQNVASFLFVSDSSLSLQKHAHTQQHHTASTHKKYDSSLTSWIGDTARSLSLRATTPLAHGNDDGTIGTSGSNRKKKNAKKSSKNGKVVTAADIVTSLPSSNWSDYTCMSCGTLLFPPVLPPSIANNKNNDFNNNDNNKQQQTIQSLPSNIYIRPLKRSKTRRRRASRTKAKELHNRSLSIQRRGTSNAINMQLQKDVLLKEKIQKVAASYCLGDGRAKNCLVMKCTYCGTKRKRKGVEVKPDAAKINRTRGSDNGGKPDKNANQQKRIEATKHNNDTNPIGIETQIRANSDYISLSSIGGGISGKRKHAEEHTPPLLLAGKKKKKKKKPVEKKKGDLMDFLSSLND